MEEIREGRMRWGRILSRGAREVVETAAMESEESGGRKRALYSHSVCVYGQGG
jgi:hypothetical protein